MNGGFTLFKSTKRHWEMVEGEEIAQSKTNPHNET